jgi:competence protein ComEA
MKKLLLVLIACFAFALNAFAAVNINTATQAELETIKGIGPTKAKAIIDYRAKTPFKSVDDLDKVKGFGKKSIDKIRKEISVSGATVPSADKAKTVGNETAAATGKTADSKTAKDVTKVDDKAAKKKTK